MLPGFVVSGPALLALLTSPQYPAEKRSLNYRLSRKIPSMRDSLWCVSAGAVCSSACAQLAGMRSLPADWLLMAHHDPLLLITLLFQPAAATTARPNPPADTNKASDQ